MRNKEIKKFDCDTYYSHEFLQDKDGSVIASYYNKEKEITKKYLIGDFEREGERVDYEY